MRGIWSSTCLCKAHLKNAESLGLVPIALDENYIIIGINTDEIYRSDSDFIAVSGWYIYKDKPCCHEDLFNDIVNYGALEVLRHIECGQYFGMLKINDSYTTFSDWAGLNRHFYQKDQNSAFTKISPIPSSFGADASNDLINEQGFIIGNKTNFQNVCRFPAGCYLSDEKFYRYFDLDYLPQIDVFDIADYVENIVCHFKKEQKVAGLSSGFDSRFCVTHGNCNGTYTWSAPESQDAIVAREISSLIQIQGFCFAFDENDIQPEEVEYCQASSEGINGTVSKQLFSNYHVAANQYPNSKFTIDGFLGDTLLRSTYVNGTGILSYISRIFNLINTKRHQRHLIELYQKELSLLDQDYPNSRHTLTLLPRITLARILYGRGVNGIGYGSQVMQFQFFNIISPFLFPIVTKALLSRSNKEFTSYLNLSEIFSEVRPEISQMKNDIGYDVRCGPRKSAILELTTIIRQKVNRKSVNYRKKFQESLK